MATELSQFDPEFLPLLKLFSSFTVEALGRSGLNSTTNTVFGLWPDLRLAYTNPGWARFAAQNDGEPEISRRWRIGCNVAAAISEPLRPFFVEQFARCLWEMRPWEFDFDCSSPEMFRLHRMTVYPLNREGLLAVSSPRMESPHTRTPHPPIEDVYRNEDGLILLCAHCLRVRRPDLHNAWEWVPAWARRPPESTSHGLCEACFSYYYAPERRRRGDLAGPFSMPLPQSDLEP